MDDLTKTQWCLSTISHINDAKIVSFDVFDTLLLRPYLRPADLFYHLEQIENRPGFAIKRQEAEHAARSEAVKMGKDDCTYDTIYENIEDRYKSMKDKELALEMQVLTANPEMKQIWDYAKAQGKKIIVMTDMYLPVDFIAKVLKKAGFVGYDKLYVSSDVGKLKGTGSLFKHVIDDLGMAPSDILHIGDNPRSDIRPAKKNGLRTAQYRMVSAQYFDANRRVRKFADEHGGDLFYSIALSLVAWRWHKREIGLEQPDYWTDLGYELGGPACYSFMRWVEREANKRGIDRLLIVARDGWVLQKIFDSFKTDVKTSYIYASRHVCNTAILDYDMGHDRWDRIYQDDIIDTFAKESPEFAAMAAKTDFKTVSRKKFLDDNIHLIKPLAEKKLENYRKYLENAIGGAKHFAMMDMNTTFFSAKKLLEKVLEGRKFDALYMQMFQYDTNGLSDAAYFNSTGITNSFSPQLNVRKWAVVELLMTSPEFPIIGLTPDGRPIYDHEMPTMEADFRKRICPKICEGEIGFAKDIMAAFGPFAAMWARPESVVAQINNFIAYPSREDYRNFFGLGTFIDSNNKVYLPLFTASFDRRHLWKSCDDVRNALWKSPWQKFFFGIIGRKSFHLPQKMYRLLGIFPLLQIRSKPGRQIWRLFGFLPLLVVKRKNQRITNQPVKQIWRLFGLFPLWIIRYRGQTRTHRLLGVLPIIKVWEY